MRAKNQETLNQTHIRLNVDSIKNEGNPLLMKGIKKDCIHLERPLQSHPALFSLIC